MKYLTILACLVLVGCGADGEPVKPTAKLGIGVGSNGLSTALRLGTKAGPGSVSVGL